MLRLRPISLRDANEYVRKHHRHHKPVAGHKFSIGCEADGELVGVIIAGRPVSRYKAISEPIAPATAERLKRGMKGGNKYGKPVPGQPQPQSINRPREHGEIKDADINPLRNKRDVWKINTVPFKGGHYAAYPPKLVETCLLAGCPEGGIVLDPFMGSGTTGMVAAQMGRHFVGIELNPEYTELAYKRIGGEI